jgi:hypothetical protein
MLPVERPMTAFKRMEKLLYARKVGFLYVATWKVIDGRVINRVLTASSCVIATTSAACFTAAWVNLICGTSSGVVAWFSA